MTFRSRLILLLSVCKDTVLVDFKKSGFFPACFQGASSPSLAFEQDFPYQNVALLILSKNPVFQRKESVRKAAIFAIYVAFLFLSKLAVFQPFAKIGAF